MVSNIVKHLWKTNTVPQLALGTATPTISAKTTTLSWATAYETMHETMLPLMLSATSHNQPMASGAIMAQTTAILNASPRPHHRHPTSWYQMSICTIILLEPAPHSIFISVICLLLTMGGGCILHSSWSPVSMASEGTRNTSSNGPTDLTVYWQPDLMDYGRERYAGRSCRKDTYSAIAYQHPHGTVYFETAMRQDTR
jgi:hypothetical protein